MISLVIPCYNEGEVLRGTYAAIVREVPRWDEPVELIFVDDGSRDDTWEIITELVERDLRVRGVRLARNFGHQAAVGAGLEHARGDAVVVLDADLQDPPALIHEMLEAWRRGFDVVYAQRNCRQGESLFKRVAGNLFYRLLDRVTEVSIPRDTGDFALVDARVVREMLAMREHALFWRGLRCWAGGRQTAVRFDRPPRAGGQSKYTLRKLIQLACNGIFSFSSLPLRLSLYVGGLTLIGSLGATIGALGWYLLDTSAGWPIAPAVLVTLYVGSTQLLCLGVTGEYVSRIYDEVRARPRWIVRQTLGTAEAGVATAMRRAA